MEYGMEYGMEYKMEYGWNVNFMHIMSWNNFCVYFRVLKMAANGVEASLLSSKLSFSSMSQTQKFL